MGLKFFYLQELVYEYATALYVQKISTPYP